MIKAPSLVDYATPQDVSARSPEWPIVCRWLNADPPLVKCWGSNIAPIVIVTLTEAGRQQIEKDASDAG